MNRRKGIPTAPNIPALFELGEWTVKLISGMPLRSTELSAVKFKNRRRLEDRTLQDQAVNMWVKR
jgi:hypothetical protein